MTTKTLERIGLWEVCHFINMIRADKVRLENYNLNKRNKEYLTILLRRADYLDKQFVGSEKAHYRSAQESNALHWAIAIILHTVGEVEQV